MNITLTGQEAQDIIFGDNLVWEVIDTKIIDISRWEIHKIDICKHVSTGKHYSIDYRCGATESQDTQPFEFELDDKLEFSEVEKKMILVEQWVIV